MFIQNLSATLAKV